MKNKMNYLLCGLLMLCAGAVWASEASFYYDIVVSESVLESNEDRDRSLYGDFFWSRKVNVHRALLEEECNLPADKDPEGILLLQGRIEYYPKSCVTFSSYKSVVADSSNDDIWDDLQKEPAEKMREWAKKYPQEILKELRPHNIKLANKLAQLSYNRQMLWAQALLRVKNRK